MYKKRKRSLGNLVTKAIKWVLKQTISQKHKKHSKEQKKLIYKAYHANCSHIYCIIIMSTVKIKNEAQFSRNLALELFKQAIIYNLS